MSIQFQAGNDSFLRTIVAGFTNSKFPVTFGMWIKYDAVSNAVIVGQCGANESTSAHQFKRDWTDQQQYVALSGSGGVITETAEGVLALDTWYWLALTRTADNNGTLYLGEQGQAAVIINNISDSMGALPETSDWKVAIASPDLNLIGAQTVAPDFKAAEIALWDRVLSTAELDQIKEGSSPGGFTSSLRGHWGVDSTVEAEALADQTVNGNDLAVYKQDGTAGVGTVPILYVVDHPSVTAGGTVSATLVQDDADTPYASKSGLHYALFSGSGVGTLTSVMTGTNGSTDANGVMTLTPPGVSAGDKLILNVFDPTGSDIHAADTVVLIGSVQVQ